MIPPLRSTRRGGYTMAEATLSLAVFGVALAGLFPLVVTQLRVTHKLETRFQGNLRHYLDAARQTSMQYLPNDSSPAKTYHAVPWRNTRMRALLGGALITTDPGNLVDDYVPMDLQGRTLTPVTLYDHRLTWSDSSSEPQIAVDVNVEVP